MVNSNRSTEKDNFQVSVFTNLIKPSEGKKNKWTDKGIICIINPIFSESTHIFEINIIGDRGILAEEAHRPNRELQQDHSGPNVVVRQGEWRAASGSVFVVQY
jgi:hypothetical protein